MCNIHRKKDWKEKKEGLGIHHGVTCLVMIVYFRVFILSWKIFIVGSCSASCRIFSGVLDLCSLNASSISPPTPSPAVTTENISRHCQMPLGGRDARSNIGYPYRLEFLTMNNFLVGLRYCIAHPYILKKYLLKV